MKRRLIIMVIGVWLTACQALAAVDPVQPSVRPTHTPAPTATLTPTATSTPTATFTPAPSPTPTPLPSTPIDVPADINHWSFVIQRVPSTLTRTPPPGARSIPCATQRGATCIATPTATATPITTQHVFAIGDSVMLGAVGELRKMGNNVEVNAQVSRQIGAALSILKQRRAAGQADEVVIVHIGDNGYLALSQFEGLMQLLADVPRVIVFNLKEPRQWERPNNQIIAQVVARYRNAVLVDWHTYGLSHPELFARDGIHIGAAGARAYVALIAPLLNVP